MKAKSCVWAGALSSALAAFADVEIAANRAAGGILGDTAWDLKPGVKPAVMGKELVLTVRGLCVSIR